MGTRPRPATARRDRALKGARLALAALAVAGLVAASATRAEEPKPEPLSNFPRTEISIDSRGTTQKFHMYVAATEARRDQGLMFVKSLRPHEGMLFAFARPQVTSFWMKNTILSLDILFVGPDGRIIRIAEHAVPGSLATINSMGPTSAVLEFVAGTVARLGIAPGDRVHYPPQTAE